MSAPKVRRGGKVVYIRKSDRDDDDNTTTMAANVTGGTFTLTQKLISDDFKPSDIATHTVNDIQKMSDDEFVSFLNDIKTLDIPEFLANSDTQRFVTAINLNNQPQIVDSNTFDKMSGTTWYRTVNGVYDRSTDVGMTGKDIAEQTMYGELSRIGGGYYGDGFYFADTYAGSVAYGKTVGDISKTAVMRTKIDSKKEKTIDYYQLDNMLRKESPKVQRAINKMVGVQGYNASEQGYIAYAIKKGYNTIDVGNYKVVLDRSVLVMDKDIRKSNGRNGKW